MRPVGKHILIKEDKTKTSVTKKGLILDQKNREDVRYIKASVINVGDEVSIVNKNDIIYYDRHAGFDLDVDNVIYKVVKENDVVVIL